MEMQAFKKFSLTHFAKHKGHPKSPYDPKTMQTMEPAEFSSTPKRPSNAESPLNNSRSSKTPAKKRKQYDTSSFLEESCEEEENCNPRLELSSINDSREESQKEGNLICLVVSSVQGG